MGRLGRLAGRNICFVRLLPLITVLLVTGCQTGSQCNIVPDDRDSACLNEVARISRELDKPKYVGLVSAIDFHPGDYPIRTTDSHQRFSDTLLSDYLDNFEKVGVLVRDRSVSPAMAYEELGFELEKAWCNKDVRDYMDHARKAAGEGSPVTAKYAAFEELAKYCLAKDNMTCRDMDRMELLPRQ